MRKLLLAIAAVLFAAGCLSCSDDDDVESSAHPEVRKVLDAMKDAGSYSIRVSYPDGPPDLWFDVDYESGNRISSTTHIPEVAMEEVLFDGEYFVRECEGGACEAWSIEPNLSRSIQGNPQLPLRLLELLEVERTEQSDGTLLISGESDLSAAQGFEGDCGEIEYFTPVEALASPVVTCSETATSREPAIGHIDLEADANSLLLRNLRLTFDVGPNYEWTYSDYGKVTVEKPAVH